MNFDAWQQLWQEQAPPTPADAATVKATIRRVRTDARAFDRAILWRDLREIIAALVVSVVFAGMTQARALEGPPAWSLALAWLGAALPLGVAGFLLIDRLRARKFRPRSTGTVLSEIDHALAELRHQHWLLMHVTWWYLLPLAASGALSMMPSLALAGTPEVRLTLAAFTAALLAAVNYPIWWLNRRVATRYLAPRIEQLERERRSFDEPI